MSTLCVIPARGGSKRIPRKNIKEFCGKPIIKYSIEAALQSELFTEIMVSTDDYEVAGIAKKSGAKIPFMRSAKNSNDFASTLDVLNEVISEYKKIGKFFDYLCCIYPCAPFITSRVLCESFEMLQIDDIGSVMPVCQYPVPIEWAIDISLNKIKFKDKNSTLIRSQDLLPYYYDAGAFYFTKINKMIKEQSLTPQRAVPVILRESEVQDIDNLEDWKIAEMKYKLIKGQLKC